MQKASFIQHALKAAAFLFVISPTLYGQGYWSTLPDMPVHTGFPAGQAFEQRAYLAGGVHDLVSSSTVFYLFDPADSSWNLLPPLPQAKCGAAMVVLDGKLYVLGGSSALWAPVFKTMHIYDPVAGTWSEGPQMPTARAYFAACALDGKIYALGGSTDYLGASLKKVDVYDPATHSWSGIADLPEPRGGLTCASLGGKIYAIGGGDDYFLPAVRTMYVYDPVAGEWSNGPEMPTGRLLLGSCVLEGKIYTLGGASSTSAEAEVANLEAFDPASNTWKSLPLMPTVRQGLAVIPINKKIYAIGGTHDFSGIHYILNEVEVYDPALSAIKELGTTPGTGVVLVSPNPGDGRVILSVPGAPAGRMRVGLRTLEGKTIRTETLDYFPADAHELAFRWDPLDPGLYIITVAVNNTPAGYAKLVIQ